MNAGSTTTYVISKVKNKRKSSDTDGKSCISWVILLVDILSGVSHFTVARICKITLAKMRLILFHLAVISVAASTSAGNLRLGISIANRAAKLRGSTFLLPSEDAVDVTNSGSTSSPTGEYDEIFGFRDDSDWPGTAGSERL